MKHGLYFSQYQKLSLPDKACVFLRKNLIMEIKTDKTAFPPPPHF